MNTSLIDHLQEYLFVLTGVLAVNPPGLFAILGIFKHSMVAYKEINMTTLDVLIQGMLISTLQIVTEK